MKQQPPQQNPQDGGDVLEEVSCAECGHRLPQANMALHLATHQRRDHPNETTRIGTTVAAHGNDVREPSVEVEIREPSSSGQTAQVEMARCETCGKDIPVLSQVAHEATCHVAAVPVRREASGQEQEQQQQQEEEEEEEEDTESPIEGLANRVETTNPFSCLGCGALQDVDESTITSTERVQAPSQQWPCPRCTLLNPNSSNRCEVCSYTRGANNQNNNRDNTPHNLQPQDHHDGQRVVRYRQVQPQRTTMAASAVSVARWTLLGALCFGPIGALVAGGTAAAGEIINQLGNNNTNPQQQLGNTNNPQQPRRRPFITFTTTRIMPTAGGGSRVLVTSNASGQRQSLEVYSPNGTPFDPRSPTDQRILQMLLLHSRGSTDNNGQLSYEELLERFGVGTENRRGASPETIEQFSTCTRVHLNPTASEGEKGNESMCNICLEDFKEGDERRKLDECSHAFHKPCIDRWLSQVASCPICKKELEPASSSE